MQFPSPQKVATLRRCFPLRYIFVTTKINKSKTDQICRLTISWSKFFQLQIAELVDGIRETNWFSLRFTSFPLNLHVQ